MFIEKAKVTSKNQITLPRKVRERMRIRRGDIVRFKENENGEIVLSVERGIESSSKVLDGCLSDLDLDAVALQHMIPKIVVYKLLKELK